MHEFQAIAKLTRQSDFRSLCGATLRELQTLAPGCTLELLEGFDERGGTPAVPEIEFWVVRRLGDGVEIERPTWLPQAVPRVPTEFEVPCVEVRRAGLRVWCLGELAGVWRFVTIAGKIPSGAAPRITRLLTIFHHLLVMIDRYERDALTGLLNRQSFDYRFEELLERHRQNPRRARVGTMPWLAIADIDHYKRINDTWGHLFGDEILLLFSRLLTQSFRSDDLLFRYGGEEFVLILNNTTAQGALSALERFRESIGNYAFPTVGRVTVSIGWVCIQPNALPSDLMHKADQALYHAKGNGRNQVTSWEATFGELEEVPQESSVDLF